MSIKASSNQPKMNIRTFPRLDYGARHLTFKNKLNTDEIPIRTTSDQLKCNNLGIPSDKKNQIISR